MSLVTVAIPVRNRSSLLRRAIRSVISQSYQDFRILISDNASSENIGAVIAEFNDSRIDYIRHEESLSMVDSWRFVLTHPRTKYVAWLHDDDYWLVNHLSHAVSALESAPLANLFSCAVDHVNEGGLVERQVLDGWEDFQKPQIFSPSESLPLWLRRHNAQCSALVFRRSVFEHINWGPRGLYRTLDYMLAGQAALSGDWVYDPRCTAHYWLHAASDTSQNLRMLTLWSVQSSYVIRYLGALAVRERIFDEERLAKALDSWEINRIAGLITSFSLASADRRLQDFARRCLEKYPHVVAFDSLSRSCRVAAVAGIWYLSVADYVNYARVRWWPAGSQ